MAVAEVNEAREVRALLGIEGGVSASRRVGPGWVEIELGVVYARLDTELARLDAGGVGARVGYLFEL